MCTCFCTQGTGKDEYSSNGIPLLDPGESFQVQFEDNILLEKGENIHLLQDEDIILGLSGTTSSRQAQVEYQASQRDRLILWLHKYMNSLGTEKKLLLMDFYRDN